MNARHRSLWESRLPLLGIAVGFIGITFLSFASFLSIDELRNHTGWVEHTHQVRFELEQILLLVRDAQAATRRFAIDGKSEFLEPYEDARRTLPAKLVDLDIRLADNPAQARNGLLLKTKIQHIMELQEHTISLRRNNDSREPALTHIAENNSKFSAPDGMRVLVTDMQEREVALLVQREQQVIRSARDMKLLIIFGTVAAYLMFGGAFWLLAGEISQRKRADKALLEANRELVSHAGKLERANKELESFSYSISHDLRIPLRAVSGYASMLTEDYTEKLDSEGQRLLSVIRESSKRMGELIDDLLAFSKLGRQALSSADIDMRGLVDAVVMEMHERDPYRNTNVVLEELPHAWGDRALLQQVWINLVSNALKYSSKKEGAEIRISGTRNDSETIYEVRDNGVGFDMQYCNKLFGVFQRLHSIDAFPGTGVGLAIVHRIVLRHGGRVWAKGAVDEGAAFFFALPNRE
jgi:signal transduction histidine kinase